MKIVIQCAGGKVPGAGSLRTKDGRRVRFVAHPPPNGDADDIYVHPDEQSDDGRTWRERLLSYNREPGSNPLGLRPAYRLYQNQVYRSLADHFGTDNLFILSAGWGLIPSSFLTPDYDITFSNSGDSMVRRRRKDAFDDWAMIEGDGQEPIVFFGGKAYLPHFRRLTEHCRGPRVALYNSDALPCEDGVRFVRYQTRTRTNWHYEAARALMDGMVRLT